MHKNPIIDFEFWSVRPQLHTDESSKQFDRAL